MRLTCIEKIQLRGYTSQLLVAGGDNGKVYLMRVPSLHVIHTFESPSTKQVKKILPLFDGDSFVCGFSCETLSIWRRVPAEEERATKNGHFTQQLLMKGEKETVTEFNHYVRVIQLKHDHTKLVSYFGNNSNSTLRVWDINAGQCLSEVNNLIWGPSFIVEIGNSGLLLMGPQIKIWNPLESKLLANIKDIRIDNCVQLSNGNLLTVYTHKKHLMLAEYQVVRWLFSSSDTCHNDLINDWYSIETL